MGKSQREGDSARAEPSSPKRENVPGQDPTCRDICDRVSSEGWADLGLVQQSSEGLKQAHFGLLKGSVALLGGQL